MSFRFPSHNKSVNRRREWREFQKEGARLRQTDKKTVPVDLTRETERIEKTAQEILALNLIERKTDRIRVWASYTHFYDVTVTDGAFSCYCTDQFKHGICPHIIAAQNFDQTNTKEKN